MCTYIIKGNKSKWLIKQIITKIRYLTIANLIIEYTYDWNLYEFILEIFFTIKSYCKSSTRINFFKILYSLILLGQP